MTEPNPGGYVDRVAVDAVAGLPATDPNIAAADHGDDGVVDHERHLGDFVDDENTVLADACTAALEPDVEPDGADQ